MAGRMVMHMRNPVFARGVAGVVVLCGLLSGMAAPGEAAPVDKSPAAAQPPASQPVVKRTKAEVDALVQQAGASRPDWWDSVPLKHPDTLDLTWSNENTPGWDTQRKLGPYLFSVIGGNPTRYREGVKLLHHVVLTNKDHPQRLARSMDSLAFCYYDFLDDPARAMYWWQMADKVAPGRYRHPVQIARCYFKLGSKDTAAAMITAMGRDLTRDAAIARLWAEMDEPAKALAVAQAMAPAGLPDVGHLAAGDICRKLGQFDEAIGHYQKVLAVRQTRGRDLERNKLRAQRNLEGVKRLAALDVSRLKDGTYSGQAVGYIKDATFEVRVQVKGGRIVSVDVTNTRENRPLYALTDVPEEIVAHQGVQGVDVVSGATMTSDAILNATTDALSKAAR